MISTSAPFIIWTLRRTGGTNLAQSLFNRSPLPKVPHEPFNSDRLYGHISKHWMANKDARALREAVARVLQGKALIKHCVETVPEAVDIALAEESVLAGYRHVFLYRRNALNRLLSLSFAQRSGVWGPSADAAGNAPGNEVFSRPLPVDHLVQHELMCRRVLRSVHTLLQTRATTPPLELVFEELFESEDRGRARVQFISVLQDLGLSHSDAEDLALADNVLESGVQGTRSVYGRFSNADALENALAGLGEFRLSDPPTATA